MLCEVNAKQVEQALARLHAGEGGAFGDLLELAYAWLGQRVVAILRGYPGVKLPADEALHDRVEQHPHPIEPEAVDGPRRQRLDPRLGADRLHAN